MTLTDTAPGMIGGAIGLAAAGPVGAFGGYGLGSLVERAYNGFGGLGGLGGVNLDTLGSWLDRPFGNGSDGRESGATGGRGYSSDGSLGDGSYSSQSGFSDNSPQGIL
jgi:hypothetical protein